MSKLRNAYERFTLTKTFSILRPQSAAARKWALRLSLFLSVLIGLAAALVIAIAAAFVLTRILDVGTDQVQPADLTGTVLSIVAGVGGVVFLVVAYRKQRDLESGRFVEQFGAAAQQLGHTDPAVRMAGVYAMAGVADQVRGLKRQQCIDVLCGYLRLPYSPETGANHQHQLIIRRPSGELRPEIEEHHSYRQNDRVVRQTIIEVISAHLRTTADFSWSYCNFDFHGVVFEDAVFYEAHFTGSTSFREARFTGSTSFREAHFTGENTSFHGTHFSGESTNFSGAHFTGYNTWFSGAHFTSRDTWFDKAHFTGKDTWFDKAHFSGESTSLHGTHFSGDSTNFYRAHFASQNTWFEGAHFTSGNTFFDGAHFTSGNTSFDGAHFAGIADFKFVDFGSDLVTFMNPKQWDPPPTFDWDTDPKMKPDNVRPAAWPPEVVPEQSTETSPQ
ncbi:pentapeptide repeat-containing protein [Arthrobacter sp. HLT1-21]